MMGTYTHLSNADIDRVMLTRAGITTIETKKDESLKPLQCSHCGKVHEPTAKFCIECGTPLTKEAKKVQSEVIAEFEEEDYTPEDIRKAIQVLRGLKKAQT